VEKNINKAFLFLIDISMSSIKPILVHDHSSSHHHHHAHVEDVADEQSLTPEERG
jgi:hypothetical protein